MKIKKIHIEAVEQQGLWEEKVSKQLEGAIHIETYTQNTGCCGERRDLIIYAFYPDSTRIEELDKENRQRFETICRLNEEIDEFKEEKGERKK